MKIGIVGWGVEGQSAYRFFGPDNEYLICSEEPRPDFPAASEKIKIQSIPQQRTPGLTANVEDLSYLDGVSDCDKIVYTPVGRKNLEKLFPEVDKFWHKATTIQHIFFEEVKTKNIIGVTGTKGKGTTSTLIAKMLETAGFKTFLGGNIGKAVLDFVHQVGPEDWVVLELANFQLYRFPYSPHIAVCLMVTEEHMDWHPDIGDYLEAKANLFAHQTEEDIAIYLAGDEHSQHIAGYSKGVKVPYFASPGARVREDGMIVVGQEETQIIKTGELKLLGEHNWQNVCAAVTAAWQVTQNVEAMQQVLASFSGLEHRLELVRELGGITYIDDSFGTTPDTTIVALHALPQPAVLILGGWDKGLNYDALTDEIAGKDRVRHVITIGKIGPKLAEMLRSKGFTHVTEGLSKMPEIVAEARAQAQPGDAVLLSCGTSSFGLFADYKDRGNQFKAAVTALAAQQ